MRIRKAQAANYTTVTNNIINCRKLSLKAKGLYLYLFSKPDNWTFSERRICSESKDGRDSIRSGLKELEKIGLLERVRKPPTLDKKTGRLKGSTEYLIHQQPPWLDFPTVGKSDHIVINSVSNKYYTIFNKKYSENFKGALATRVEDVKEAETLLDGMSLLIFADLLEEFFKNNPTIEKTYPVFVKWAVRKMEIDG